MTIEKEEKPKKLFRMEFVIWDDGEIQRDLIEYVYGERGAPKQWRMEPKDFTNSIKAQVGGKLELFNAIMAAMDVNVNELKKIYNIAPGSAKVDDTFSEDETEEEDLDFDE